MQRIATFLRSRLPLIVGISILHVVLTVCTFSPAGELVFRDAFGNPDEMGGDFFAIYQAGFHARHGVSVYEYMTLQEKSGVPYGTVFRYVPACAYLIGVPLSLLPPMASYALWMLVLEILLLLSIMVSCRLARDRCSPVAIALLWVLYTPYYIELYMGQFSFAQAALILAMLYFLHENRRIAVSSAWTCSLLLKTNTLLFLPSLLRLKRWAMAIVPVVIFVGMNGIYFLFRPGDWSVFSESNLRFDNFGYSSGNFGLMNFLWALSLPGPQWIVRIFPVATLIIILVRRHDDLADHITLWMATYFLFYKHVWEHHYVMALPVLVWQIAVMRRRAFLLPWALFAAPTLFFLTGWPEIMAEKLLLPATKIIGSLLFYSMSASLFFRGRGEKSTRPFEGGALSGNLGCLGAES